MSAAKVKIAPIERWCPASRAYAGNHPSSAIIVGAEVEILTETMEILNCDGIGPSKYWQLTPQSDKRLDALTCEYHPGIKLCEHLLEMD